MEIVSKKVHCPREGFHISNIFFFFFNSHFPWHNIRPDNTHKSKTQITPHPVESPPIPLPPSPPTMRPPTPLYAALALLSVPTLCSAAVESCPCFDRCDEEALYHVQGSEWCYRVHYEAATWYEAEAVCAADGGRLADFTSVSNKNFLDLEVFRGLSSDCWVGVAQNKTTGVYSWNDAASTTVAPSAFAVAPSNAVVEPSSCAFYSAPHLFPFDCSRQLRYLCQRAQTSFDVQQRTVSAATALSGVMLDVVLTGSFPQSRLFLAVSSSGCDSATFGSPQILPGGTTSLTYRLDTLSLQLSTSYELCWGLLPNTTSTTPSGVAGTDVTLRVPGYPTLVKRDLVMAKGELGTSVTLTGSDITEDVWIAVFEDVGCTVLLAPPSTLVAGSGVGVFTLPLGLVAGPAVRHLCLATSRTVPAVADFFATEATVLVKPLPVLDARSIYLTNAESTEPQTLLLSGQYMSQPSGSSIGFFNSIECKGEPLVALQEMKNCGESSCQVVFPASPPTDTALHACVFAATLNASTEVVVTAKPPPAPSSFESTNISYAEILTGTTTLSVSAVNLHTNGRGSGDSNMVYAVFVENAACTDIATLQASHAVYFESLTNISPVGADVAVPSQLRGTSSLCYATAAVKPTSRSSPFTVHDALVQVRIAGEPSFTTGGRLVTYKQRLSAEFTVVSGVNLANTNMWISFATKGGACGAPMLMPAVSDVALQISIETLYNAVAEDGSIHTVVLCWAPLVVSDGVTPPGTIMSSLWQQVDTEFTILPRPEIVSVPAGVVFNNYEGTSTTDSSVLRRTMEVGGAHLQVDVMWVCMVLGVGVDVSSLVGASCVAASVSCSDTATAGWCAKATFQVPPVAPQLFLGNNALEYTAVWMLSLERPTTVSAAVQDTGYRFTVGVPTEFVPEVVEVSIGKLLSGFDLSLGGLSLGAGVYVWLQGAAEVECTFSRSNTVQELPGWKTAANATLAITANHPGLSAEETSRLCFVTGWGNFASPALLPEAERSVAAFSGVALRVAFPPVFNWMLLQPSLSEVWGNGFTAALLGSSLVQADLWGAVCRSDCTECSSDPFVIEGGSVVLPKAESPMADPSEQATLCWAATTTPSSATYKASSVRIVIPGIPRFNTQTLEYSAAESAFTLPPASPALPDTVFMSFCGSAEWVAVVNNMFAPQSLPQEGVSRDICMAFDVQSGVVSFPTGLTLLRLGVPKVVTETVEVAVSAAADGAADITVTGVNLSPGVWVGSGADCGSASGWALLGGSRVAAVHSMAFAVDVAARSYVLCWAYANPATGTPLTDTAAPLNVTVNIPALPVFTTAEHAFSVSQMADDVNSNDVTIEVSGTDLTNDVVALLHEVHGDAVDCNAGVGLAAVFHKRTAQSGFVTVDKTVLQADQGRLVELCWYVTNSTSRFASGVRVDVAGLPTISGSGADLTFSLRQVVDLKATVQVSGENINTDTAVFFNCDTSRDPVRPVALGVGNTYMLTLPAWVATPSAAGITSCVSVVSPGLKVNVTSLVAIQRLNVRFHGLALVQQYSGYARPLERLPVRGDNIAPSDVTPGIKVMFSPRSLGCPEGDAFAVPIEGNGTTVVVPTGADGIEQLLCIALQRGGGSFDAAPFVVTLRDVAPPTEVPDTKVPLTDAPKTDAPKTEAPETSVPDTIAPTAAPTPVPCPSVRSMGTAMRDTCFYGNTGLVTCLTTETTTLCAGSYVTCIAGVAGDAADCFATPDRTHAVHYVLLFQMDVSQFHATLFSAAVAATCVVPPSLIEVTSVTPGSTRVSFSVTDGETLTSEGLTAFTDLGTWGQPTLLTESNTTDAPPAPTTMSPDDGGVSSTVVALVVVGCVLCVAAVVGAVLLVRRTQKDVRVAGPCGLPAADCICATGACRCDACAMRGEGVVSLAASPAQPHPLYAHTFSQPSHASLEHTASVVSIGDIDGGALEGRELDVSSDLAPETIRRNWMATPEQSTPAMMDVVAGGYPTRSGGRATEGGVGVGVGVGAVGATTTPPGTSASAGSGSSRASVRRWMLPTLPPQQKEQQEEAACRICGNAWEGGRYVSFLSFFYVFLGAVLAS